jgi:hypothetical protein
MSPALRQYPSKRREEGAIGRSQREATRLPSEHDELMS